MTPQTGRFARILLTEWVEHISHRQAHLPEPRSAVFDPWIGLAFTRKSLVFNGYRAWIRTMNNASKGRCVTVTPRGKCEDETVKAKPGLRKQQSC